MSCLAQPPGSPGRFLRTIVIVGPILAVFVVHGMLSWGHVNQYWGDSGRWLYEVERSVEGARIYRDVYWGFPPFGMWVMTAAGRWLGTDLNQIWTATAAIMVLLGIVYAAVVGQLLPTRLALPAGIAGASLGVAYAGNGSSPLVSGMYLPAVPIAALIAFAQLALLLRQWRYPSLPGAAVIGALAGTGLLTKHDVWIPCLVMAAAAALLVPVPREQRRPHVLAVAAGLVSVGGAGLWILAAQVGADQMPEIFSGYGQMQEFGGMFMPNLAQVVVQAATLGVALVALALIASISGIMLPRRAVALGAAGAAFATLAVLTWLLVAEVTARQLLLSGGSSYASMFESYLLPVSPSAGARARVALAALRFEMLRQVLPVMGTALFLVVAWTRRRAVADRSSWLLACLLLGLVLAFNARRQLAFSEWSTLMLAAPGYAYAAMVLWRWPSPMLQKLVTLGCAVLVLVAAIAHHRFGYGVGTHRGKLPAINTARGPVRIPENAASDLNSIREATLAIDPTGQRPLLAFGYSAGHNYWLDRPGVGALTHGFRISVYPSADSAYRVAAAQRDRLILIDIPFFELGMPVASFEPWRWQPRMIANPYVRVDRPLFERLLRGCRPYRTRSAAVFKVYDCAPARMQLRF